jgi:hypothetical protein
MYEQGRVACLQLYGIFKQELQPLLKSYEHNHVFYN